MKKRKQIILCILLLLIALLAVFLFWQRSNVRAVWKWLTLDSETIAENYENHKSEHHDAIVDEFQGAITVKPPSAAQSGALLDGKVSPEEVKEALGLIAVHPDAPDGPQTAANQAPAPTYSLDELVNQCISELYSCKVDVMAELGVLKQSALDEWIALEPKQRTKAKRMDIVTAGLQKCYDKEVVVDREVEAILDKYREKINQIQADTSVLDTLWEYYCQEKEDEKAYYLDKYVN